MVELHDLIIRLSQLTGPDRDTDKALAAFAQQMVQSNSAETESGKLVLGGFPERTPPFTRSVDHAFALAQLLCPGMEGGFSWEKGSAHAKINDGPYFFSTSPAIALCAAVVNEMKISGSLAPRVNP